MTASRSSEAFFHRRQTHKWIADLAAPQRWTIYAGLGVSIDRTGLTWDGLVDAMLTRFIPDPAVRNAVITENGPIRAATILDSMYSDRADPLGEVRTDLSRILYGPRRYMNGRLASALVEFALVQVRSGGSVAIVTPNYDDYLYRDLKLVVSRFQEIPSPEGTHRNHDIGVQLVIVDRPDDSMPEGWSDDAALINYVHVHGYVPEDPTQAVGEPVLTEEGYSRNHGRSASILTELFRDRNVLILGSSVTDAPLVEALLATKPEPRSAVTSGRDVVRRIAVLPGADPRRQPTDIKSRAAGWATERLKRLAVQPIFPDFYVQTSQLLHEATMCLTRGDADQMLRAFAPRRYGARLLRWWREWSESNCGEHSTQAGHHQQLLDLVFRIRQESEIPLDEALKAELWVRWEPEARRDMTLWASSVGTWIDPYTMRRVPIETGSRYASVRTFVNGAPLFSVEDDSVSSRWRTYLGVPIWHEDPDGVIPVGVITLASDNAADAGSSLQALNLPALDGAIIRMREVGQALLSGEPS